MATRSMAPSPFEECFLGTFKKMLLLPERQRARDIVVHVKRWRIDHENIMKDSFAMQDRHIALVRDVMNDLPDTVRTAHKRLFEFEKRNWHDWTKTRYYMFVVAGVQEFNIDDAELQQEYRRLVENHYRLERHHPEWEKYNEEECDHYHICEMAVDRLAVNLQKNGGIFNQEYAVSIKDCFLSSNFFLPMQRR